MRCERVTDFARLVRAFWSAPSGRVSLRAHAVHNGVRPAGWIPANRRGRSTEFSGAPGSDVNDMLKGDREAAAASYSGKELPGAHR
jgi:hypothetical protein